jgi:hypothetical protein
MSGQRGAGVVTTLEDLFLSHGFGRPAPVPTEREGVLLRGATGRRRHAHPARNRAVAAPGRPRHARQEAEWITTLEDIFLSREFGRPLPPPLARDVESEDRFLAREFGPSGQTGDRVRRDTPLLRAPVDLGGWRSDHVRNRAVAVASGVAAAALVVAGFAAGTPHNGPTGVSAQGPTEGGGGGGSIPGSPTPGPRATTSPVPAPLSVAGASGSASSAPVAVLTAGRVATPTPTSLVEVPPGTTVTVAPTAPSAPSPAPSAAPPPTAPSPVPAPTGNPLAPVVTAVANTVTSAGSAVSAASSALAKAAPVMTPVTTVVGTLGSAVSGVGQRLGATVE